MDSELVSVRMQRASDDWTVLHYIYACVPRRYIIILFDYLRLLFRLYCVRRPLGELFHQYTRVTMVTDCQADGALIPDELISLTISKAV